uniref:macro domain-containing protein n=1 Tax=Listeria monocytogenes TaxID=1639 RepID=UPI0018D43FAF
TLGIIGNKQTYIQTVQALIQYYSTYGGGQSLYLPLLGNGLSDIGVENQELLSLLVHLIAIEKEKLAGCVNIVLSKEARSTIGLKKYIV